MSPLWGVRGTDELTCHGRLKAADPGLMGIHGSRDSTIKVGSLVNPKPLGSGFGVLRWGMKPDPKPVHQDSGGLAKALTESKADQ